MSVRDLLILGTASQVPTRERNHNGYLVRWDGHGILFDPGEGTQRQLTYAGVAPPTIDRLCITHFHGDHCLGLPGVLQRLALDGVAGPIDLHVPAGAVDHARRLIDATVHQRPVEVTLRPTRDGDTADLGGLLLRARRLDHGPETLGWRLEEPSGRRMLPDRLEAAGVRGPAVGHLQRDGRLETPRGIVRLEDVSVPRRPQALAVVMDTRWCRAAIDLAADTDLLLIESTFLEEHRSLAESYGHLTARQAAEIAVAAGVDRLVLTHFSQRYREPVRFYEEAAAIHPDVVVASDLDRIPLPPRGSPRPHAGGPRERTTASSGPNNSSSAER